MLDYKDPKWLALRELVLKRDHGKCRAKNCKSIATVVHHARYSKETFEEPLEWLFSLCEKCHNNFHKHTKGFQKKKLWTETLKLVGIIEIEKPVAKEKIIILPDDWRLSPTAVKSRTLNKRKKSKKKQPKKKHVNNQKIAKNKKVKSRRGAGTPKGAERLYEERRAKKRAERLKHL